MAKQTMGTPATALRHRTDNKLYHLQSGQTPIVRPAVHNLYSMDSFPNGTNAVVAVISYTGYDMEDAMILNKSAHERGFAYGTIYKSHIIDLKGQKGAQKPNAYNLHFGFGPLELKKQKNPNKKPNPAWEYIGSDGLPAVGWKISRGDSIAAYMDDITGQTTFVKYKGDEVAYIDTVRLLG